jgi:hypothetical protein
MKTRNRMTYDMKTTSHTILGIMALSLASALGQQPSQPPSASPPPVTAPTPAQPPGPNFSERLQSIIQRASAPPGAEPSLTKFELDFPGGTPKELVAAIEKAIGRPVNVFVAEQYASARLPALKMSHVTLPAFFRAVGQAGGSLVIGNTGYSRFGFMTQDTPPSDDSIWYFYASTPPSPDKACRFYSLAPYVDNGLSVDDITTAIETGWKMLWEEGTSMPKMKYHKDTKLLIAVGESSKLETIDAVLKALQPSAGGGIGGGFPSPGRRPAIRPPSSEAK